MSKDGRLQWQNAKAFGANTFYQHGTREEAEEASRKMSIRREPMRVVQLHK